MTEKANRKSLARSADSGGRPRPCGDRGARKSKRAIRSHDPVARLPGSRHRKGSDHWHNSSPPRPLDIDRPADGLDGAAKDIGTVQVRSLASRARSSSSRGRPPACRRDHSPRRFSPAWRRRAGANCAGPTRVSGNAQRVCAPAFLPRRRTW